MQARPPSLRLSARLGRLVGGPYIPLILLASVSMICVSSAATMPLRYGDLGWQRWIGETIVRSHHVPTSLGDETFTAVGARWIPHEWLFAVATTMTESAFSATVFAVCVGACVSLAIGIAIYRTWERSRSSVISPMAIVLISAMIVPFDSLRAEYIGWLFLALALLIIESDNARSMSALLPLSILWANVHASVVLLPFLLAIRALSLLLSDRHSLRNIIVNGAYAIGTLLCSWINPVGANLITYAMGLQQSLAVTTYILEWQRPTLANPVFAFILLPMVLYGIAGCVALRKWWDLLLLVAFGYLSIRAGRHIALFAIAAAPAAFAAFSPNRRRIDLSSLNAIWTRRYAVTLAAVFLTAIPFYALFSTANGRVAQTAAYAPAVDAALALPGNHRVYCQDFAWCSLIVGRPRFAVWWDGRADSYPLEVWRKALAVAVNRPAGSSQQNLDRYRVDVVIVKDRAALNDVLVRSPQWHLVTDASTYRVWQREVGKSG